jgi:hypothetical protein
LTFYLSIGSLFLAGYAGGGGGSPPKDSIDLSAMADNMVFKAVRRDKALDYRLDA